MSGQWRLRNSSLTWVGIDLEQVSALETFINTGRAGGGYEIECCEEREYGEPHRGEQRGQWRAEERSNKEPRCDRGMRRGAHRAAVALLEENLCSRTRLIEITFISAREATSYRCQSNKHIHHWGSHESQYENKYRAAIRSFCQSQACGTNPSKKTTRQLPLLAPRACPDRDKMDD